MKLIRLTLVCSLLLLAAVPSFAITCSTCIDRVCQETPGTGTRCRPVINGCQTVLLPNCTPPPAPVMLSEWTVASIEISRPAAGTKVVTTPAAVAEAASPATLQQ
jgi:hypothetical protein